MNTVESCIRKKRYWTEDKAKKAAKAQMLGDLECPDLIVYHCDVCDGWHLAKA